MFGFSGEHLLILLVVLLIFGPRKLPDLGHSLGKTLKNFKDAMNNSVDKSNSQAEGKNNSSSANTLLPKQEEKTLEENFTAAAEASQAEAPKETRI